MRVFSLSVTLVKKISLVFEIHILMIAVPTTRNKSPQVKMYIS